MASSSSFSGAIVLGDQAANVYFAPTDGVTTVGTGVLMYGNLTAPAAYVGGLAIFGEGQTQGESVLHAFDVLSGTDIWAPAGLQFSCSFDATPALSADAILYIAGSNGFLYAIDITTPTTPALLWTLNVLQLATASYQTVTANLLSQDETQIYLATATGLYGVQLVNRNTPGTVIWSAASGSSFALGSAFVNNTMLVAVSGSTVYGYDTTATPNQGTLSTAWQYAASATLSTPENLDCVVMMVGDSSGTFHALDIVRGTQIGTVASGLSASAVQNSTVYNGLQLVSVSGANQVSVYNVAVTPTFGSWFTQAWTPVSLSGVTLAGAPYVTEGAIYVATTTGTLYALSLANGTQFWSRPLGATTTLGPAVLTPIMAASTAAVQFLMDGDNYFVTMKNLLIAAKNGNLADGSNPPSPPTFENLVQAVAAASYKTYVLMWDTSTLNFVLEQGNLFGGLATLIYFEAGLNAFVNEKTKCNLAYDGVGTYLEPYPLFTLGSLNVGRLTYGNLGVLSQHQKIAIFNVNGTRLALVSGLNIGQADWDFSTHPMSGVTTNNLNTYSGRHDTGVLLQGPAVTLVEQEFDRRWAKSGSSSANPGTSTYVKIAGWAIHHDMCLDVPGVCQGKTSATPFTNPSLTTAEVPVSVLLTNADDPNEPIRQIQAQVVQAIDLATQYIYLENFAIHDIAIVQALVEKLTTAGNSCIVILMIPAPPVGEALQEPMIRATYALLQVLSGAWTELTYGMSPPATSLDIDDWNDGPTPAAAPDAPLAAPVTIQASQVSGLKPLYGGSVYDTRITYTNTSTGQTATFPVNGIVSLTMPSPSSSSTLVFCSPARYFSSPQAGNTEAQLTGWSANYRGIYVHSKLALFDDTTAIIGSGNFNGRSMQWDGEMSALVKDTATVTTIRSTLFAHWGMTTAAAWVTTMNQFAATSSDGVGVLPLAFSVLSGRWPRKLQRIAFDTLGVNPSAVM